MASTTIPATTRPQTSAILAMLLRFQARARLAGPRIGNIGPAGQMAWFVLGKRLLIPFWINPQSYRETSEAIAANQPTPGLIRRTYFTAKPQVMSLEGTTGTAGWDARRGGMVDLGRLKPFVGLRGSPVDFYYPYMFARGRYCFVNRFQQEARAEEAPLFYYYQIELAVYPQGAGLPCGTVREARPPGARQPPGLKRPRDRTLPIMPLIGHRTTVGGEPIMEPRLGAPDDPITGIGEPIPGAPVDPTTGAGTLGAVPIDPTTGVAGIGVSAGAGVDPTIGVTADAGPWIWEALGAIGELLPFAI